MTLEEVKLEFEAWRTTQKNKMVSIPSSLWQKVYDIHQNYKPTQICKTLRLNSKQFKNKIAEFSSSKFVEIPINPTFRTTFLISYLTVSPKIIPLYRSINGR